MDTPLMRVSWSRLRESEPADAPATAGPPAAALAGQLAAFWKLDAVRPFTASATRLYCYWLQRFEVASWPAALLAREQLVAAHLSLSTAVVRRARLALVGRGLLTYTPGADGTAPAWALSTPLTGEEIQLRLTVSPPPAPCNS